MVMNVIYVYDDTFDIGAEQLHRWEVLLSKERIQKMNTFKFQKDKVLCIIAFLLMRFGLEKEYNIIYIPSIYVSEHGKMLLKEEPLFFNMSHCDMAVGCAVDNQQIGLDIQDYSEAVLKVKHRFLTEKEQRNTKRNCVTEMTRIWTMKEAYGKYYGYGMKYAFWEKDFSFIHNNTGWQNYENLKMYSRIYDKYALSVCSQKCMPIVWVNKKSLIDFAERKLMT